MKSAKQQPKNNAARARNIRGKKHGKGKKPAGEKENGFEAEAQADQLLEDNSEPTSLEKIHAKVQREVEDKQDTGIQKKDDPEVSMKTEDDSVVSKKEENVQKEEKESPDITMKADPAEKETVQTKAETTTPLYNAQYFRMEDSGDGNKVLYVKEYASSYDAVHDVVKHSSKYTMDNSELLAVSMLCVKAKEIGKEKFDTEYVLKEPVCIKLANESDQN